MKIVGFFSVVRELYKNNEAEVTSLSQTPKISNLRDRDEKRCLFLS